MRQIRQDQCPELCAQLALGNTRGWTYLTMNQFAKKPDFGIASLALHYDLYTRWDRFSELDELISRAASVTLLTLGATARTLVQRNAMSFAELTNLLLFRRLPLKTRCAMVRRRLRKQRVYKDGSSLPKIYDHWIDYVERHNIQEHWLLDSNQPGPVVTAFAYDPLKLRHFTQEQIAGSC